MEASEPAGAAVLTTEAGFALLTVFNLSPKIGVNKARVDSWHPLANI
jgi:hypothetical protein